VARRCGSKVLMVLTVVTAFLTSSMRSIELAPEPWGLVVDEQQCRVSGLRRWSASGSCTYAPSRRPYRSRTPTRRCR
jgi:hypothetical protein